MQIAALMDTVKICNRDYRGLKHMLTAMQPPAPTRVWLVGCGFMLVLQVPEPAG